jgi:5'-3' exonuclease
MVRLHEQLKYFVNKKISTDPGWQGLKIYLSGHEVTATAIFQICWQFISHQQILYNKLSRFVSQLPWPYEQIPIRNSNWNCN